MVARGGCDGIVGIRSGDDLEDGDGVGNGASHGTGDVGCVTERHDAGATGESHGRPNADERLMRRRSANRVAGVGAQSRLAHVRCDGSGGAAAGPRGHAIERVRIPRIAGQDRVHGLVGREREFRHVGLREHDGAGLADALDLERVFVGDEPLKCKGARRRGQVARLEVVLHDHRNAVQRANEPFAPETGVERVGGAQRVRVHDDDRVDRRSFLVVGLDAREVLRDKRVARETIAFEGGVDLCDGRLFDSKLGRG